MPDILDRLESHNEYCMSADTRQVLKDAAEEIRRLMRELADAKINAEKAA